MQSCHSLLTSGLDELNIIVEPAGIERLLNFIGLLDKWNKTYNLTAVRNPEDMVHLHLLDSLAVLPFIAGARIADVGTGAGLPGIPLAICLPDTEFTLLDSNSKKTRFVQQAVLELKLKNVRVYHGRAQQYRPDALFDQVVCRAFAVLQDIVSWTAHLLAPGGELLAMKGRLDPAELDLLFLPKQVLPLRIPGIDAERCLVRIQSLNTEVK
ncbi:MAG: 16S rRNA (guanine(527)-N(7))-methyltransferase RsmG [Gammaproteobacteria bacterium]